MNVLGSKGFSNVTNQFNISNIEKSLTRIARFTVSVLMTTHPFRSPHHTNSDAAIFQNRLIPITKWWGAICIGSYAYNRDNHPTQ